MSDTILKYAGLKLTLDGAEQFVANMKKATHETMLAYEEMKRLRYEQKASGDAAGTAAAVQKQMAVVYQKQAASLKTVRMELQKYREEGSNTAMIDKLSEKEAKLETQLARTKNQYRDITIEAGKAQSAQYQFGLRLEEQGKRLEDYGNKMLKFGATMSAAVTLPLTKIAKSSVEAAVELETTMANVRKVTNLGDAAIGRLEQSFRDLSKEIPISTQSLGELAEAGGRMFKQKDDLLEFTRMMADLNNTTNIVGEEGSEAMMRFMSVVKTAPSEFQSLGSSIVDLGNNFTTTESDILLTSKNLASAGRAAGMSTPDILAFGAALSSMNIKAEKGGTAISRLITTLEKEVASGGDKLEKFASIAGMTAEEFADSWRKNPTDALMAFFEGMGKVQEQGGSLISVLDELSIRDIRMSDVVRLLSINHDDLAKAVDRSRSAWQNGSALQQEAAQRYATTAAQLEIQKNRLQDVAVAIGQKLIPILVPLGEKIVGIADAFSNLDPSLQNAIINFGLFAAAIGPMTTVAGAVSSAIGGMEQAVGRFMKARAMTKEIIPAADEAVRALGAIAPAGSAAAAGVEAVGAAASSGTGLLGKFVSALTGPAGIVLAAGAAVGAIGLLVAKMTETSGATKEIQSSVDELQESFNKEKSAIEENYQGIALMAARLEELASATHPTNDQISLMNVYIEKLNEQVPGLGLSFDAATGKINKSAEEMDAFIKSAKDTALAKVYIDQLSDAYQKMAEADLKIAEKESDFKKLGDAVSEAKKLLDGSGTSFSGFLTQMEEMGTTTATVSDGVKTHLEGLYETMRTQADKLEQDGGLGIRSVLQNEFDWLLGQEDQVIGEMKSTTAELQGEVTTREEAYRNYAQAQTEDAETLAHSLAQSGEQVNSYLQTATGAMVEIVSGASADFEEASSAYQSALESAKSNTDQWATGLISMTELSLEEMQENARQNLETMTQWRDDLYELHGKIPEDVYEMFQRLGPSYSSVVEQLANMEESELAPALADMVLLFADTRLQTAEELGKMPEDQAEALGAMLEWLETNGYAIPEQYRTLFENASTAAEESMHVGEHAEDDVKQATDAYEGLGESLPPIVETTGKDTTTAAQTGFKVGTAVGDDAGLAMSRMQDFQIEIPGIAGQAGTLSTSALEDNLDISGVTASQYKAGADEANKGATSMESISGDTGENMTSAYREALNFKSPTDDEMKDADESLQGGGDTLARQNSKNGEQASAQFRDKLQQMKFYTQDILKQTAMIVRETGETVTSNMSNIASASASAWRSSYGTFRSAGAYTMDGLVRGINSRYSSVVNAAASLASAANSAYRRRLAINSPSRVMEENGRYTVEGLVRGVIQMKSQAARAAEEIADVVMGGLDFSDASSSLVIPAEYTMIHPQAMGTGATQETVYPGSAGSVFNVTFEYYGTTESERDQFDRFANYIESRLRRTQSGLQTV